MCGESSSRHEKLTKSTNQTNETNENEMMKSNPIPTHKSRWCVARPAGSYPLTFMHVAAILCIAASAIVP